MVFENSIQTSICRKDQPHRTSLANLATNQKRPLEVVVASRKNDRVPMLPGPTCAPFCKKKLILTVLKLIRAERPLETNAIMRILNSEGILTPVQHAAEVLQL